MKKILYIFPILTASILLSGCSLSPSAIVPAKNTAANATVLKSEDGGKTWNPKIKVDDKKTIAGIDVLTMAVSPADPNVIYLGTESNGLFQTIDAGETWKQVPFPDKVYGLVFDPNNANIMYGSGVFNGRAKIFKRIGEDQEWKDIYTEPADGTTIASLAINNRNPQVLYAGTSEGVIIKTTDAGATWVNIKKADGPVTSVAFDAANDAHVYFGIFQTGALETKNAGASLENVTEKIDTVGRTSDVYTLVADPFLGGVAYAGTSAGLFRRTGGDDWKAVNIIESSKAFPIRVITVNPKSSKEIMYSSSKAIYKSVDGGATWATFQLETSKEISILKYISSDPTKIYAGLRSF